MDLHSLDQSVRMLFKAGLAPATLKAYRTGTNRYISFCALYNIINPFPLTEDVLSHYVAFLYKEGLKAGTVKSYPAATRYTQILLGLGNPHMEDMSRLEYVIRGVKKLTGGPPCTRLPITLPLLAQLRDAWHANQSVRDALMLWTAATMCFFDFLRVGEVVRPSDLEFGPSIRTSVSHRCQCGQPFISYICCGQYQGCQDRPIQARGDDLLGSDTWYNMSGGQHAQIYGREGPIEGSTVPVRRWKSSNT